MKKPATAGRGENTATLVSDVEWGTVDAHNSDADRVSAPAAKLRRLVPQIVNHPVNLFKHSLSQDLDLHPDFDGGNLAPSDFIATDNSRLRAGDYFTKC